MIPVVSTRRMFTGGGISHRGISGLGQDPSAGDITSVVPGFLDTTGGAAEVPSYDTTQFMTPGPTPPATAVGTPSGSVGSGLTPAQIAQIIATGGQAAVNIAHATQSPYLIPGTNIIANPGGTPIVGSGVGVTGSQLASSLMSFVPLIFAAVIGVVVISAIGKK